MRTFSRVQTSTQTAPLYPFGMGTVEGHTKNRFVRGRTLGGGYTSGAAGIKYEQALEELGRELARVKETERQRMAEQLHDGFGQELVLAKMRLSELSDSLPPRYGSCVDGITDIIGGLIQRTRTVIHDLYPQPLSEGGLKAALQCLAKELQKKHGFTCTTKLDLLPNGLDDRVQQILFRAVRELLFNVVKHARASEVRILVTRKPGSVGIRVCDNGEGFDRRKTSGSDLTVGKFGLFSVRADLASVNARLHLYSRLHHGTKAVITLLIDAH